MPVCCNRVYELIIIGSFGGTFSSWSSEEFVARWIHANLGLTGCRCCSIRYDSRFIPAQIQVRVGESAARHEVNSRL